MSRYAMLFKKDRCIGCNACVVACQQSYGLDEKHKPNWVEVIEEGEVPEPTLEFIPMLCGQCDNAGCIEACPVDEATYQKDNGVVVIIKDECISCEECIEGCPYGARTWDEETDLPVKCDFCHNRIIKGEQTFCVKTCPTEARLLLDLEDLSPEEEKMLEEAKKLEDREGTIPEVYFL